jgi:hypothetical protein
MVIALLLNSSLADFRISARASALRPVGRVVDLLRAVCDVCLANNATGAGFLIAASVFAALMSEAALRAYRSTYSEEAALKRLLEIYGAARTHRKDWTRSREFIRDSYYRDAQALGTREG